MTQRKSGIEKTGRIPDKAVLGEARVKLAFSGGLPL